MHTSSQTIPAQGALVLAGGFGRRFGDDKRRRRLADGRTLLETTLDCYRGLFDPLIVVLRPEDRNWSAELAGCDKVFASDARLGMGHSLAAGVAALGACAKQSGAVKAVFVALGDMPWVKRTTLQALRQAMRSAEAIVRPTHLGALGHPVGFGCAYFPDLRNLTGDLGAKALLNHHAGKVISLSVHDPGILRDVDRSTDLPSIAGA